MIPDHSAKTTGRPALELLLASFTALLLELALIRWLPEQVRVIAYFPNLILIASFLGLGVGALGGKNQGRWIGPSLLVITGVAIGLGRIAFTAQGTSEHLWLLYYDLPKNAPVINNVVLPIGLVFLATAVLFIPLGGTIAGRIQQFKVQNQTLEGYTWDLVGSFLGVVAFLVLASLGTHPIWWFLTALVAVSFTLPSNVKDRLVLIVPSALALFLIQWTDHTEFYSPYYAIRTVSSADHDVTILTNGSLHQQALDLRLKPDQNSLADLKYVREGYHLPLDLLRKPPQRALVLGAGSGNDVTVLLDAGVPEIHAVEIDPVIIELGRTRHPAHPYQDPRVIIHNTDARAFLETTPLKFDLIVFGTLDSMTRLSALSNVRLDNFVYTVESLKAARAHLTPDGGVALMFMAAAPQVKSHLYALFWHAFDEPPAVYNGNHLLFNQIYFGGPGYSRLKYAPALQEKGRIAIGRQNQVPTDDWPYLYLERPEISSFYVEIGVLVLTITLVLLFGTSAPLRESLRQGRCDYEMMLLGAAFLLCETGFVTQMNLLFGATWLTSAIIVAAILAALIGATLIARSIKVNARLALAATVAAIVIISCLPLREIAPSAFVPRIGFALIFCGVPLTFAGLVFAARFSTRAQADVAFGWNVLGAVVGGLLEMSSMLMGLRGVFLGAALLYALTYFFSTRKSATPVCSSTGTESAPSPTR